MKKLTTLLAILLVMSTTILSQSLATNILFEQANVVCQARVEKITYSSTDAEGASFVVSVIVEKLYKNNFYGKKLNIRIKKLDSFAPISDHFLQHQFQIKAAASYFFFLQKIEAVKYGGEVSYFTNLTDAQIEAIPFSTVLEKQFKQFDSLSYLKTNNYGSLPFKILMQASPFAMELKVEAIEQKKKVYYITGRTEKGKVILIKTLSLNCICEEVQIKPNEKYLFFLSSIEEGEYLLTDQWLGIFQIDQLTKYALQYAQEKKAADTEN